MNDQRIFPSGLIRNLRKYLKKLEEGTSEVMLPSDFCGSLDCPSCSLSLGDNHRDWQECIVAMIVGYGSYSTMSGGEVYRRIVEFLAEHE